MASLDDAIKLLQSGRLREGMEILERLVRNDPENGNVLYNLGMCYSELGNIDKSIRTLENVCGLRLSSDAAPALQQERKLA
jgi:tetratricopeptide (TPR) repeat protein